VTTKRPKGLTGRHQKVGGSDRPSADEGDDIQGLPPGYRLQPNRSPFFSIDNWVSPLLPISVVSRPQGRGMEQRVNEVGGSESRPVMGRIGPRERGYPTRKGADFRLVLTSGTSVTSSPLEMLDDETCFIERTLGQPHGWKRFTRADRLIRARAG
jgi:hypothetical protein